MDRSNTDKITQFLSTNPLSRYRDISGATGLPIAEVRKVIESNDALFRKDFLGRWCLVDGLKSADLKKTNAISGEASLIHVPASEVVEKIREELNDGQKRKVGDLAGKTGLSRSLIRRTLEQFPDLFCRRNSFWMLVQEGEDGFNIDLQKQSDKDRIDDVKHKVEIKKFDDKSNIQRTIIEARIDKSFLVLAPPGTGKTYTLIERIMNVTTRSESDVKPEEILVLSFTRAAVNEVRNRISQAIRDGAPKKLRYVRVKTFDAYATWLLEDGGYDLQGLGYDERIVLLTQELSQLRLKSSTNRISRTRHLFVDEIQDLVGCRANMVFELIKRILTADGSVTLLGDPNQTLNDYQVCSVDEGSSRFLKRVRSLLEDNLEQYELEHSFRYENEVMKDLALSAKSILEKEGFSDYDRFNEIKKIIPKLDGQELKKRICENDVDAILCRSNLEVFQWEAWLNENSVTHSVNFGSGGSPWPAWIGQAVLRYQQKNIPYERFVERANRYFFGNGSLECSQLNEFLEREKLIKNHQIDLADLAFKINYLNPLPANEKKSPKLTLSTVHKAKGLEYKNVVLSEPYSADVSEEDVRVLYVGLTRAKQSVSLLPKEERPFSGRLTPLKRSFLKPKRFQYSESGRRYFQVMGRDDFDLETLFVSDEGSIDKAALEKYFEACFKPHEIAIAPEKSNGDNSHSYALFVKNENYSVRVCAAGKDIDRCLNSLSWGGSFGDSGIRVLVGKNIEYQTIVHPLQSPILTRIIGPSGIMIFPHVRGFYELEPVNGE